MRRRWRGRAVGWAMVLAGLAGFAWATANMVAFGRSLAVAAPALETDGAMPGMAVMGIALVALGVLSSTPVGPKGRTPPWTTAVFGVALAATVFGVVLLMMGPPVVGAVMRGQGYVRCGSRGGFRTITTLWAADAGSCPGRGL